MWPIHQQILFALCWLVWGDKVSRSKSQLIFLQQDSQNVLHSMAAPPPKITVNVIQNNMTVLMVKDNACTTDNNKDLIGLIKLHETKSAS